MSTFYLLSLTCLISTLGANGSSQVTCPISCPLCPCFTVPPFEFDVEENSPIGMSIATLTATPGSDITYSSESSMFIMDSMTGVLSVGGSLDYEVQNRYEFRVAAVSSNNMPGRRDITINILNRNEFSPHCSETLVHFSIMENQGMALFQLPNCTDGDFTIPYIFTYEVSSFNNFFSIDENHLFNVSQPLDYETKNVYDIIVIVKDADIPPGSLNTTIRVILTVEPENEYPPVFVSSQYVFELNETASIGSVVGTVSATDMDSGIDGHVLYSISPDETDIFVVNEKTGNIVLARMVDYEIKLFYTFSILATDSVEDAQSRLSVTTTVSINVLDSNDNTPAFLSPFYYMDISENTSPGFFLKQISCTDLDSSLNQELVYSITAGNNEGYFSIDESSGNVTLASTIDYDNSANSDLIPLTIECREVAVPHRSSSTQFLITITGYNTFFPQSTQGEFSAFVPEDTHPGTSISSVTASDRDRGVDGLVRYYISNNAVQSQLCPFDTLSIDENSGHVYLLSPLDYENGNNELYCVITMRDSGYPEKESHADLFVSVVNVNDNKPRCFPSAHVAYVAEDTLIGDILFSIPCNDTDGSSLQYTVQNDFFTVTSTGNLILEVHLNFESDPFHFVSIIVSDGVFITNISIRIIVEPVNEHVPLFFQPIFYCSVEENTPIGTILPCYIRAEDQDDGTDGEIQYRLESSSPFSFDNQNVLFLTADIDYESQQEYISQVEAFDLGIPSLNSTALIHITVLDKNDNKPRMLPLVSESIRENSLPGTLITNLFCIDADEGLNGVTNIRLLEVFQMSDNTFINVTDFTLFNVSNSNLLLYGEIDFETISKYQLNFLCTDSGIPPLSTSSTLFLDVVSENEFSPVILNSQLTIEIAENTNVGDVITRVIAVDGDDGKDGDILFSLNNFLSYDQFPFDINEISGEIVLWHPLNCEQNVQYTFNVIVEDRGIVRRSSHDAVVVNITTCHLGNMIPLQSVYSFSIEENAPFGENVGLVSCSSNRTNVVTSIKPLYRVVSSDTIYFDVNAKSGSIVVINSPDFELQAKIKIVIECYDPNFRGIAANVSAYIIVLPINEFAPTFVGNNLVASVFENTPVGTSIMQLNATDQDDGIDGQIEFSIFDEDSSAVIINQHTGEVYLVTNLDREATSEITFTAIAQNLAFTEETKMSSTTVVTITIKDQNDNWPICNPIIHHVIVSPKSEPPYTVIDTFGCVDNDINENAELTFRFSDKTVPSDLFRLSSDSLLLINKLSANGPSQYNIPILVSDRGTESFTTNLLVVVDIREPDHESNDDTNKYLEEGLENAIWIHLLVNDITISLSQNEHVLQRFQQVVATSVTHYCALFPGACSLISGCSEFIGVQQKRSLSNNYVVFEEWSVMVLSENLSTINSDMFLDILFYVTIPIDSRSQHRETDYVIPRATMNLIIEQDGTTIEAVVRDSAYRQQAQSSQQQEWIIIVSVVSGIVGSFLLMLLVFAAVSIKKRLKRQKTVVPLQADQSHIEDSVHSKCPSTTSSVSSISNKATCDDNRFQIRQLFQKKSASESSVRSSALGFKGAKCVTTEPDIQIEDVKDSLWESDDNVHSSGETSMENIPIHARQESVTQALFTRLSLFSRKGSS